MVLFRECWLSLVYIIDFEDNWLGVIAEMLAKNVDATDVYRIGFDSQAYLDKRLLA